MKVVVLMVVVVAMVSLATAQTTSPPPPLMPTQMPTLQTPACISTKLGDCAKNVNYTKLFESIMSNPNDIQYPCCSEWDEEIKDNRQCVCNAMGSYVSSMAEFFKVCKIDVSADTMCKDVGKSTTADGNGANIISNSLGLLPIMLLIFTIILKF
ncbi:unnamed protein product [Amaranthus hypochondriacus]